MVVVGCGDEYWEDVRRKTEDSHDVRGVLNVADADAGADDADVNVDVGFGVDRDMPNVRGSLAGAAAPIRCNGSPEAMLPVRDRWIHL